MVRVKVRDCTDLLSGVVFGWLTLDNGRNAVVATSSTKGVVEPQPGREVWGERADAPVDKFA
jgi:hypothetical protein